MIPSMNSRKNWWARKAMKKNPFIIFPWQRAFLPDLKAWVEKATGHNCGAATIIIPNRRPWRHLCELFKADKKAATLPKVFTFPEVIGLWQANMPVRPVHEANTLDQVALLEECVGKVAHEDKILAERFSAMEMRKFLPWGMRLANIFEELFIHGREAYDIANLDYEVDGPAAALLGALGKIGLAYRDALASRNWTTPGHAQYIACKNSTQIPRRLLPTEERPVFIAGFVKLNGTENTILKALYESGAQVCLHTDSLVASKKGCHWACEEHSKWINGWKAKTITAFDIGQESKDPQTSFFSGYDTHSQLGELGREITQKPELSSVIVLANEDLLMPLLHQLPEKNVNISMGYPASRSPFAILLKDIFALHANDIGDERHYWKNVLAIINHPYLKRLGIEDETGAHELAQYIEKIDERIRCGGARVNITDIADKFLQMIEGELASLFDEFSQLVFSRPGKIESLSELAAFLKDFIGFLLRNNKERWENFYLDQEAIHRILQNIVPVLENNNLASRELPLSAIMDVFNSMLEAERIPFTSEKFDNIQILGMLETRLLNFDRVFFLDATDDVLPGTVPRDPLLPNSLRSVLGLPDSKSREKSMAHNLYRLCKGAREAHFYWQEGVNRSDVTNGKKSRSRFVEQLIWEEEKKRKNIFKPGDSILKVANAPVSTSLSTPKSIEVDEAIRKQLGALLKGEISSTELETYLNCPLQFAYKYLLRLSGPNEPCEDNFAGLAGNFVHKALQRLFTPWIGRKLDVAKILAENGIETSFKTTLNDKKNNFKEIFPAHAQLRLEYAYYTNIDNYLKTLPQDIIIRDLELKITNQMNFHSGQYLLNGRIDRVDDRKGKLHIVDYKTGRPPVGNAEFWMDEAFFSRVENLCLQKECSFEDLAESLNYMQENLPSLQLPFYLLLVASQKNVQRQDMANAAFVDLICKDTLKENKDPSKNTKNKASYNIEKELFQDLDEKQTQKALDYCALCIDLTMKNIRETPKFEARISQKCDYCPFGGICAS